MLRGLAFSCAARYSAAGVPGRFNICALAVDMRDLGGLLSSRCGSDLADTEYMAADEGFARPNDGMEYLRFAFLPKLPKWLVLPSNMFSFMLSASLMASLLLRPNKNLSDCQTFLGQYYI